MVFGFGKSYFFLNRDGSHFVVNIVISGKLHLMYHERLLLRVSISHNSFASLTMDRLLMLPYQYS